MLSCCQQTLYCWLDSEPVALEARQQPQSLQPQLRTLTGSGTLVSTESSVAQPAYTVLAPILPPAIVDGAPVLRPPTKKMLSLAGS